LEQVSGNKWARLLGLFSPRLLAILLTTTAQY